MSTTGIRYLLIAQDSASKTFDKIGRSASGTDRMLSKLGKTAVVAGAALAGGLAVGLAEGAKDAARFQAEMTRISTQAGGTAKDVKVLSDQVLKLGTSTQQGPQHLAESLYHLKSVGMDNVQAMKALKESSDLAAVGHANLEETTNALAGAWRTGIKGATSFHEAVSTVNAIIGAGNMSMDQFNAAIGTGILPSAKTFGLSMKQVGAALALMTDEGIDSASAATRLRMSFSLLGAPSKAAEKQLGKIGLTGLNLADAMRGPKGLIGAIGLLKKHLDDSGLSASRQSQLLSRAFGGGRSSSGILLMLNNLDVLEKKQEQINHSTGKFDDAVKMQRKTAEAQWHLLTSNLEVMGIRVGTKVLPPVTSFIHFLATDAMPAAARFGSVMRNLIPVGAIKKGIGDAKAEIGGFLTGLTGGKSVGGMVSDFMDGLTGTEKKKGSSNPKTPSVALTNPQAPRLLAKPQKAVTPALKAPAVPRLLARPKSTDSAPLFQQKSDPGLLAAPKAQKAAKAQATQAQKFGKQIRDAVSQGIGKADFSKLGDQLGTAIGKSFQWVTKHAAKLTKQLADAMAGLDWVDIGKQVGGKTLGFAIGFIGGLGSELFSKDFWKKHWWDTIVAVLSFVGVGKLAGPLEKILAHIPILKMFSPLLKGVDKITSPLSKGISKVTSFFGKSLWKGIAKVFPEATAVLEREAGLFTTRLGTWGLDLLAKGKTAVLWLGRGIRDGAGFVISKIGEVVALMVRPFVKVGTFLVGKGKLFLTGLKDGIVTGAKGLGSWAWRRAGRPVVDGLKSAGTALLGRGRSFLSGLKSGVVSAAKGVGSWAWRVAGRPVVDAFKSAGTILWSRGKGFVTGMKSGAVAAARGLGSWVNRTAIKPVTGAFKFAGTLLKSAGGHFVSGLKSGVVGAIKGIGSWVKKSFVDPIVSAVKHYFGIRSPSRVFMSIGGHLVSGLVKGMAKSNGTAIAKKIFGDMPSALGSLVKKGLVSISSLPSKAMKALSGLGSKLGGFFSGLFGGGGGGGVGQWAGAVQTVLGLLGAPASAQSAVLKRISIESGGNPNAINLWDSNAKAGHPSQGLMQTIPSTFAAYAGPFKGRGITDPLANIYAGVNYAMHRYGGDWISVMTRPGGYAKGTSGAAKGLAWVGERGPELVNFKGGEDVLSHGDSMAFAKTHGIKLPGYASGTISNAGDRVRRDREKVEDAKDAVARAKRRHKGVAAAEKRLQAAEKELQAAKIALKNAQRSAKVSISNTIKTGLLKTLETGTASAITSAMKSLATKLLNAGYNKTAAYVQKQGGKIATLSDKRASVQKTIATANAYAADQSSNIKDFLSISGTSATSVADLISQAGAQQKTASNFVALTKHLKAQGASKELLQQLSDAGPGSQLASILGAKGTTTTDIAKLNKVMASGGKLATSFGKDMADMMYDTGKHAGEGFLAGLKATEKDLQKQIDKLAKDLVKQIKKVLKIKSPSAVMRDEVGKNVVLGWVAGMDMHGHLVGGAAQRLADTASGVNVRRRYVPTAAAPRSAREDALWDRLATALEQRADQPQHLTGELVLESGDLIGVIKGTVKPMIKASEQNQAFRAKVGRSATR
ncbi:phage tail tape measure protein [Streptomyces sp. NPDC059759]|uniref:phage tail tape measure protein n=1 Tax=Streptomyces sp. NPDC059759 TaxID=3346936 RepID=UPI003660412E